MSNKHIYYNALQLLTLDNVLCLILSLYSSINVLYYLHKPSWFQGIKDYALLICLIIAIVAFVVLKIAFKETEKISLSKGGNINKKEFFIYSLLILFACTISIVWNYPASMYNDAMNQYQQATTNQYSDIHPLFHTLIFFKIPTLIWHSYASCAIFQCLFIFVILLYFCYFCRVYFLSKRWTIALLSFVLLNPTFLKMATMPLKDVPFSYCLLLGTLLLIEIFLTDGEWLAKTRNKALLCLTCFGIVFFRHNGIANFLLMIIPLIVFYKDNRKYLFILCAAFTISKFIAAPIFNMLGAKQIWSTSEIVGVPLNHPLNQMSYIYNNGGFVTEHDKEIMNNINKIENWEKYYNKLGFYNLKKECNGYNELYVVQNYSEILKTWMHMAYKNPALTIKSEIYITSQIWCIQKSFNFMNQKHLKNTHSGPQWVSNIMDRYVHILQCTHMKNLMIDVGEGLLLILFSLCLTIRKIRNNKKAYLPYILVLSNVLIITCLITSGAPRFVYSSILCSYPLMLYALLMQKQTDKSIQLT
ncbi:MAG: hypothetical protein IKW86_09980 [Salinivirgaceae bacterium]|nr:hypothetical protein [Salinivirgaceae bacterium]